MTAKEKELIEKLKELIDFYNNKNIKLTQGDKYIRGSLRFGISDLESEIAKEKDEPKQTAEEILAKYPYVIKHNVVCYEQSDALKAMEEYANQFKK